jgi:predicted Zn-dependent protease
MKPPGNVTAPSKGATLITNGRDVLTRVSIVDNAVKRAPALHLHS